MIKKSNPKQRLECKLEGNELVIRIGIDTLAFAFEESEENTCFNDETGEFERHCVIKNKKKFARDVVESLLLEEEDGTTPIHLMLDGACNHAIEYGSDSVVGKEKKHDVW